MYTYTHGFYRISSNISPRDIRKMPQVAFAVNHDNGSIFISRSGHGAMMREFNLDRSEHEGGWFWPRQNKIRFVSGLLGGVSGDNQNDVQNAIGAFSGVIFSEGREDLVPKCYGSTRPCRGCSTGSTPVGIVWTLFASMLGSIETNTEMFIS
jgi:hypothetical protein